MNCKSLDLAHCFVADILGETFEDTDLMCQWCIDTLIEELYYPPGSGGNHNPTGKNGQSKDVS